MYPAKTFEEKDWTSEEMLARYESMIDAKSAAYLPGCSAPDIVYREPQDPSQCTSTDASSVTAVLARIVAANGISKSPKPIQCVGRRVEHP